MYINEVSDSKSHTDLKYSESGREEVSLRHLRLNEGKGVYQSSVSKVARSIIAGFTIDLKLSRKM